MNKKLLFLSGLACLIFCSPLLAADPLVALPQGDFSCTVDVTPHDIPKPDPAHPERTYCPEVKRISISKVGDVRRDIVLMSDNTTSQVWSLPKEGISLQEQGTPDKKRVCLLAGIMTDLACPKLLHFDADSVSWINEKALDKGSAAGAALHYKAPVSVSMSLVGDTPALRIYQAWIDAKTLVPQKFDDGDALYVLTFGPPTGPLVMPDNITAKYKRYKEVFAHHPHL